MNKEKKQFNYDNNKYIITEYLGIDRDTFIKQFNTSLFNDIYYIINKYKEDKRNIEYMLESNYRLGYVGNKFIPSNKLTEMYKDIKFIENRNGIIVYSQKI